ncbi:FAD-binding oxidoreductase [Geodermatophilus sp. SYSU D00684]
MSDPQFWWWLARSSGLVAWALLSATVVWGLLLHGGLLGRRVPGAWTAAVHRFLGVLAVLFTGLHLTGLLLDGYVQMGLPDLLVPLASDWRPVPVALGVVAGHLLLAVLGTSLLASRLPRRWWKRVHLTSYLLFWSATVHLVTAGTDAGTGVARAVVAGTVTVVLLLTLVRIARPAGATARPEAPAFHRLRVAEVRRETPDAVSVRFALPADLVPVFRFRPGQHVLLRARVGGAVVTRPYSVCSGVTDGELRIAVRRLPGGRTSTWVTTALRPGDVVDVAPPAGTFGTDVSRLAARHVLGVAAGSGITPVVSVLASVLAVEPGSRCTLVYGNRTAADTLFAGRLALLQERYPDRLRVVHLRSREPVRPPVLPGRIDREVLRLLADRGDLAGVEEAFVCGPGAMTAEVRRALAGDLGLPPGRVHTETFAAAPPVTADAGGGTVRVRHRGAEHAVPVAAGESVLDAGLRAGLDLPYGCRAGACGTCRARSGPGAGVVLACRTTPADGAVVDFDAVADPATTGRR